MGIFIIVAVTLALSAVVSAATITMTYEFADETNIFLTELQTGTSTSGNEEFVEFYNNSDQDIDFSDTLNGGKTQWKLQYFAKTKLSNMLPMTETASGWNVLSSGTANSATKTIVLSGVANAHSYFLATATGYVPGSIESDMSFSPGMAADGGAVQLISVEPTSATTTKTVVHDRLAWAAEGVLVIESDWAIAPAATNKTLQRTISKEDRYIDDNGLLQSWDEAGMTPKAQWTIPEEQVNTDEQTGGNDDTSGGIGSEENPDSSNNGTNDTDSNGGAPSDPINPNEGLEAPRINELLPNPSGDEDEEYIELYNPNDESFWLKGYQLQTGIESIHSFVVTSDAVVPAEGYLVLRYTDTKLALTNSGGRARLLDPAGQIVDETSVYSTAKEALAWALGTDGQWKWTDTPTPSKANVISMAVSPLQAIVAQTTKKSSAKVKGVSTKKPATKKIKSTKSTKAKKSKKSKVKLKNTASVQSAAEKGASIHPVALASVAVAAVAYGAYEYRKDIANLIFKFRRN